MAPLFRKRGQLTPQPYFYSLLAPLGSVHWTCDVYTRTWLQQASPGEG